MVKSIVVKPKRGRPSTGGRDPFVGIRLPKELLAQIAKWSEGNEAGSRSEAIRRLVELGLQGKGAELSVMGRRAQSLPDPVKAAADRAMARSKTKK
jgi:Arc/MetJ-type ribon-helix-helix transcriptional regulator